MDAHLAIASKRDVRSYRPGALDPETERRILDAGRLSGSARNRQPWRFLVVRTAAVRDALAACVYAPENVHSAALVVAIAASGKGPVGFDCGRAAQSMMLAAWNDGVASTPNGIARAEDAAAALSLEADEELQIVLSFGYPARERAPTSRSADEWSARANRRALEDSVTDL